VIILKLMKWMASQMDHDNMSWKFTAVFNSALIIILGAAYWWIA